MDQRQVLQDEQYDYPYHYIPEWKKEYFTQTHYWAWGFRYLGGIRVVLDRLSNIYFDSLIDIGCGDGRFLREVSRYYPTANLLGVDYSERAIRLAKAMSPHLNYRVLDITREHLPGAFDVATLIEVIEHIPPYELQDFIDSVMSTIRPNGWLILTAPHTNKPVSRKHYQHFSSDSLNSLFEPYCSNLVYFPFDRKSLLLSVMHRLLGGNGKHFVITNKRIQGWFFRLYTNRYLYSPTEKSSLRICMLCRKW